MLAILSSVVAGASLILLSVFDTKHYTTAHRLFLLFFMIGVWLTAIFAVIEVCYWQSVRSFVLITVHQYRWLSKDYPHTRRLRVAYRIKGAIALILIFLSVAFGVAMYKAVDVGGQVLIFAPFPVHADGLSSTAVLEWVIGFGFAFYLISYFWDLRLSKPGKLNEKPTDGSTPSYGDSQSQAA